MFRFLYIKNETKMIFLFSLLTYFNNYKLSLSLTHTNTNSSECTHTHTHTHSQKAKNVLEIGSTQYLHRKSPVVRRRDDVTEWVSQTMESGHTKKHSYKIWKNFEKKRFDDLTLYFVPKEPLIKTSQP